VPASVVATVVSSPTKAGLLNELQPCLCPLSQDFSMGLSGQLSTPAAVVTLPPHEADALASVFYRWGNRDRE
jgi:hypothetical protein